MSDIVYYEQPLNERIRTFLRLEHLFSQTDYTLRGFSVWDSRATLGSLVEVLEILGRSDFKTELLKELDRQRSKLESLQHVDGIDSDQLSSLLTHLHETEDVLHNTSGQIGHSLRDNELLANIRQRQAISGGTCPIDLPILHLWLQQAPEQRIEQLENWYEMLNPARKPVALLLSMIREASAPQEKIAPEGFYQQNLDANSPVQLIRVGMQPEQNCYAEISAGKHRLTIRFLAPQEGRRPAQVQDTINFELTCCTI